MVLTYHLLVKFPTKHEIGEMLEDHVLVWQCYMTILQGARSPDTLSIEGRIRHRHKLTEEHGELVEDLIEIPPLKIGIMSTWFGSGQTWKR